MPTPGYLLNYARSNWMLSTICRSLAGEFIFELSKSLKSSTTMDLA